MSDRGTARGSPLLTPRFPGLHLNFSQLHLVMWLDTGAFISSDLFNRTEIYIYIYEEKKNDFFFFVPRVEGETRGLECVASLTHAHQVFLDKHPMQAH